jgi:hypothetical protein
MAACLALMIVGSRVKFVQGLPRYYEAAATLPGEIKAARQEGLPLTPADLTGSVAIPEEQNAAPLYARLGSVNVYPKADDYLIAVIKGKATNAERKAAQRLLLRAVPQLRLVEQAAMRTDCDFHRDWSLGPDLLFPEYAPIHQTARLLAAKAMLQSEAGQPEAALATIRIGAHMAQHVGKEPTLVAVRLRLNIEGILDRVAQQVFNRAADRPDLSRMAEQTEQAFGLSPDLDRGLRGEFVMCRIMVDTLRKDKGGSWLKAGLADAYEAHSVSFWRRVFAAEKRTTGDPMATYSAIKAVDDAEAALEKDKEGSLKPTYEWSDLLCPKLAPIADRVVRNDAQRRLRHVLVALLSYRRRTGHFPPSLGLLTPAAPLDPYLGLPLHYRRTASGFRLYSVGPNLRDDGGNVIPSKEGELPPDIVTTFP